MLNVYKSNRMEMLFEALASVFYSAPPEPLKPEWIGIQSRGMKQWISIQLAQKFGVCANMNFAFPKDIIRLILSEFSGSEEPEAKSLLDEDTIFWLILDKLFSLQESENFQNLQNYVKNDAEGKKRFQLSSRIAKIFDDYQVYRPELLLKWEKQEIYHAQENTNYFWQADLWKHISRHPGSMHLAGQMLSFLDDFSPGSKFIKKMPEQISFLGIFSLPPIFLQLLEKISQIIDIHLFLLVPSNQFFLDTASKRRIQLISLQAPPGNQTDSLYFESGNPLLTSLGTAGKDFLSFIESFNYQEPGIDLFQDPIDTSTTMLSYLQSDILNLVCRAKGQDEGPIQILSKDNSVSIHACHSPMRETQILKDLLLQQFDKDPDLCLHDIIVMTPDIEAYAPFIESVFSTEQSLGFSISDRRKRSDSPLFKAFFKIIELNHERLEKTQILDLLLSEPITLKFQLQTEELSVIQKIVSESNILWGRNAEHRSENGLPSVFQNTWEFGLQRLFLGMAMPQSFNSLVEGLLPCPVIEGIELEILGKFSAFCRELFFCLDLLKGNKTIDSWCTVLNKIIVSLISQKVDFTEDLKFLTQTVQSLKKNAANAQFKAEVSFDVIHSYLESKLDQNISQGNFLSGKITFCNLMPMRSIPYKIVVLMGMDEKSFPRKVPNPGFDLIRTDPRRGDKNDRNEDRYLFLETLLSARSQLVVTYTGMSIHDNSMLPCSGVVSELCDTIDQSFQFDADFKYHHYHPLHPFHQSNFKELPFSYSKNNLQIAKALRENLTIKPRFFPLDFKNRLPQEFPAISMEDFILFFRNPLQYHFKKSLGLKLPEIETFAIEREPFKISGLGQYSLGRFLVDMEKSFLDDGHDTYPVIEGQGILPFGVKGRLEYERIAHIATPIANAAKELMSKNMLPPVTGEIQTSNLLLSFTLSSIYEDGAYIVDFGKINGPRLLNAWIKHLFLNVCTSENLPKETTLIGQDPAGKKPISIFTFSAIEDDPNAVINYLAECFISGIQSPFYFFCNTSWEFANFLSRKKFDMSTQVLGEARQKSLDTWYGGRYKTGESTDRYISYFVENNDPFVNIEVLQSSGFIDNTLNIFKPMLNHLRRVK